MAFDRTKFKNLVHYVCLKCEPSKLGSVKLNKILWLSDFRAYYALGNAITSARYIRREFGPVPDAIVPILKELERDGLVASTTKLFYGHNKTEYQARGQADMDRFSQEEMEIVNETIRFVSEGHTAKSISEISHDRVWQAANDGEELPYFTMFSVPGQITNDERDWARMEIEDRG